MCGRFALEMPWSDVVDLLDGKPVAPAGDLRWEPAYNICPTDPAPVGFVDRDGVSRVGLFRWGLVPFWAKDARIGARMINARAETVATKSAFKESFQQRPCLVPASGFYEWTNVDVEGQKKPKKQPQWIHPEYETPLTFAGLWAKWTTPQGAPHHSFTIITTTANDDVADLHDRMPVVIAPADRGRWLDPSQAAADREALLKPYTRRLRHHPVRTLVSNVRADGPELIEPMPPEAETLPLAL